MQEAEIELLRQPFRRLMYVGDIPSWCHPKNGQLNASLDRQSDPIPVGISQVFGCEKYVVISISAGMVE